MAVILEKQHIAKRRRMSSGCTGKTRHSNKSAGFYSGFMSQFRQKPAQSKKRNPVSQSRETPKKGAGFSFPVPSFAKMAVIAGTVVIALAALNWEGIEIRTPDIYAFKPAENTETSEQMIKKYAATGIPGIFPERIEITRDENTAAAAESGKTGANTTANASVNTETASHHGMLVTFEWQQHRVQRGESVSEIAQKYKVSVGAVIASNNISNARRLQEGSLLRIPNIDGIPYQIQRGDSLSRISASFNVPLEVILDVNDVKSDNIKPGETLFIPGARMNDIDLRMSLGELFMFPLPGRRFITSNYGMRKDPFTGSLQFHDGVDFRANTGTTVMAALDGVISVTGENWLYGKYIIMSHSNGYKTLYAHLNSFNAKQGDRVARGRKIAETGNTGYSTGPHLHFGMYDRNNKLINPLELLN